ncbi:MAG: hypothetical protein R2800_00920 [Flavipsychrobacter sp.]
MSDVHVTANESNYYLFIQTNKLSTNNKIISYQLDIKTGRNLHIDTLLDIPMYFVLRDIGIQKNRIYLFTDDEYLYFEPGNSKNTFQYVNRIDSVLRYEYCEKINDSLLLAYLIYNFHPADGKSGLFMQVINTNNQKVLSKHFEKYSSVALSSLNKRWLTVLDEKIYVISPLTGNLREYNKELQLLNEHVINGMFNKTEVITNKTYENYLQEFIEYNDAVYNNDTIGKYSNNNLFSKEGIQNILDTTEKNFAFIKKIFNINTSVIGICISRPTHNKEQLDLYTYNIKKRELVSVYKNWNCISQKNIMELEDFYPIDLRLQHSRFPNFQDDTVYTYTWLNPKLFTSGNKMDVSSIYLNDIKKNGYQFYILKHKIKK